jgi:site-specific DNA-methyltransferase (adenine-specific)
MGEETGCKKIHPHQKPIALYRWLLKNYANLGDKIFDSHVGSGAIRIACNDFGFDFEGCEIDQIFWEGQENRFKCHTAQAELFSQKEYHERLASGGEAFFKRDTHDF